MSSEGYFTRSRTNNNSPPPVDGEDDSNSLEMDEKSQYSVHPPPINDSFTAPPPVMRRSAPSETGSIMSNGRSMRSRAQSVRSGKSYGGKSQLTTTNRKPFASTRLKGEIHKPWLEKPDPAQRWARWITIASMIIGLGAAAGICYTGYSSVPTLGKLCLVLDDDFSNGIDTSIWNQEVEVGGYGKGEFQWTTTDSANSYTKDGVLYIVPTLTTDVLTDAQILNGYTLNLTADGTCSSSDVTQCAVVSNITAGTIINPVRSARLTTKLSHSIRYGKVEIKARMPTGDWIWPSMWMLPTEDYYGAWPISGELDIITARGNSDSYAFRGYNYVTSMLQWGPTAALNRYYWTWGWVQQRRKFYNQEYHTFGMEWTDKYLWTYVDSRVNQVVSLDFSKKSFWERGTFPSVIQNGSQQISLTDPWIKSNNNSAPFDRAFYLILSVAVGGTNGWFPDGVGDKPWVDGSASAMSDFYNATSTWYKTWPEDTTQRGLAVDYVKMWQKC